MPKEKIAPKILQSSNFCPGCGDGIILRTIYELFEDKGLIENNVCCIGVGCTANVARVVSDCGNKIECHHGRAPVTARGMKELLPDTFLWTFQGDGDAYSIGLGETIQSAQLDAPITVFVVNNTNYAMTGGQMALTTLPNQVTTTTPKGRHQDAHPLDIMSFMKTMDHVGYAARGTTATPAEIRKLKKYISNAIDMQTKHNKYSIIEILTQCPTNWHKTPAGACQWIMDDLVNVFPLGEFKKMEVNE